MVVTMAISDINKAMALYAQPTQFDQSAWKTAFDIANAFTNAENNRTVAEANKVKAEDLKRLYSNALQTDPSAIQSTIAQNNFNTTQYKIGEQGILGQHEAAKLVARYGFDKNGNAVALPETFKNATADGYQPTNPYATTSFYQAGNQERANQQALYQGIINNSMEQTVDPVTGQVVSTGKLDPQRLNRQLDYGIATGLLTKESADRLRSELFPPAQSNHQAVNVGTFTQMLSNIGAQPQIISPYRLDAQPQQAVSVMPTTVQVSTPPQTPVVALTPEQQKAALVKSLNEQQAQNELRYSGAYINTQEELKRKELENAMKDYNKPTLPFYLSY